MIQGLDHAAITVSDIPTAIAFYVQVLGMRPVDSGPPDEAAFYWLNFGPAQTLNLSLDPAHTPRALRQELDWTKTIVVWGTRLALCSLSLSSPMFTATV